MVFKNKVGLSYSILLFGVSVLVFISALMVGQSNLMDAVDVYAPNSSIDIFKLSYLSDSLNQYYNVKSENILNKHLDNFPKGEFGFYLINSKSKDRYLFNLEESLYDIYPINLEDSSVNVLMSEDPEIYSTFSDLSVSTSIFTSNYVNYRLSERTLKTGGNNVCDISSDFNFNEFSNCNHIFESVYDITSDPELSLLFTAISYLDTNCDNRPSFDVLRSIRRDEPSYYIENTDTLIGRILNLYEDVQQLDLQKYDERFLFLYLHHRGGYDEIKEFLNRGYPYQEAISRHCFSFFSNYWTDVFEDLDENIKSSYLYKQEEYFCRGRDIGMNYPNTVLQVYNKMCDDAGFELVEDEIEHKFSPAQLHRLFDQNVDIFRPIIPFSLELYQDDILKNCFFSHENISNCLNKKLESKINDKNEMIEEEFDLIDQGSNYDDFKISLLESNKVDNFMDFAYQHSKIERCITIKNKLNEIDYSLNSDGCLCLNLGDDISISGEYLEYNDYDWNLPLSDYVGHGESISIEFNNIDEEFFLSTSSLENNCDFYTDNLNPKFYPAHFSDSELDFFGVLEIDNVNSRQIGFDNFDANIYQPDYPSEEFFVSWNDISNELFGLMGYELRIYSYDPLEGRVSNTSSNYFLNQDDSFEFEYNFSVSEELDKPFVDGSSFTVNIYTKDWYGNKREVFSEYFEFEDDLPFDFANLYDGDSICDGLSKIESSDEGEIELNWDFNNYLMDGTDITKDAYENYIKRHFSHYLVGYKEFSEEDYDGVSIDEFDTIKVDDRNLLLDDLSNQTDYSVFVQQIDVSENSIDYLCDYSAYESI